MTAEPGYLQMLCCGDQTIVRLMDVDAFAAGVIAHREGLGFHENPHGATSEQTVARLSWHMGWNERALRQP
jgi:hypothetical protein